MLRLFGNVWHKYKSMKPLLFLILLAISAPFLIALIVANADYIDAWVASHYLLVAWTLVIGSLVGLYGLIKRLAW
jgi:hypothetical protein